MSTAPRSATTGDDVEQTPADGTRVRVCALDELPEGQRLLLDVDGRSIGLFHTVAGIFAVRNYCPHEGAPVCQGRIGGTLFADEPYEYEFGADGKILSCPWHHWEFDVTTGSALFDPSYRVRTYPVEVLDGDVFIRLRS